MKTDCGFIFHLLQGRRNTSVQSIKPNILNQWIKTGSEKSHLPSLMNVYVPRLSWSPNLPAHHYNMACQTSQIPVSPCMQAAILLYLRLTSSTDANLQDVSHNVYQQGVIVRVVYLHRSNCIGMSWTPCQVQQDQAQQGLIHLELNPATGIKKSLTDPFHTLTDTSILRQHITSSLYDHPTYAESYVNRKFELYCPCHTLYIITHSNSHIFIHPNHISSINTIYHI